MMFNDTSIRVRLLVFAAAFSAGMLVLGGLGIVSGNKALAGMEQIYARDMTALELLAEIKTSMLDTAANSGLLLNAGSEQEKQEILRQGEHNLALARDSWKAYRKIAANAAIQTLSEQFEVSFQAANALVARNMKASAEQSLDELARINQQIAPVWDVYVALSNQLASAQKAQSAARYAQSVDFFRDFVWVVIAALASSLIVALLLYRNFVRSVVHPLEGAVAHCERIAQGDLQAPQETGMLAGCSETSRSETGRLLHAFERMRNQLWQTVAAVQGSTVEIDQATRDIAAGTLNLSQRTEAQAASLQETSASMDQLSVTVQKNADHANEAMRLAQRAAQVAGEGSARVSQVVNTMERINRSAQQVFDIIGVIEGIAFQTNILALNAAVEAARAGEQGRGFAVVATEVRQLAQRSSLAAKEIGGLIRQSDQCVRDGSAYAAEAGITIDGVWQAVAAVETLVSQIAGASRLQSEDIRQVAQAILSIDDVTQQNSALVEQATAAADSLSLQVAALGAAMAAFHTGVMTAPVVRSPDAVPTTSLSLLAAG
jgi:methyl-accepting chemotaxis protein I, serine sensor receptor